MPPRKPSAKALDTEPVEESEDDLAAVEARAEAARTRATLLREQADAAADDGTDPDEDEHEHKDEDQSVPARRWRPHRPGRKAAAVAAAILVACAALAGSGFLLWHHHRVVQHDQRSEQFAATARNAVVTMMSIDPNKARDDMQRFADSTTGQFKAGILMGAEDMVRALQESKVVTKVSVQAVAVQSMTKDSAVVLVAAKSELTKPDKDKPEIRTWRLVVDVERDAGALKVSKIEFVP
ncbi:hypothetical protein A5634_08795 [Mycobacterium asiaticum]|uniref:Mce protein n=1 Tax=Mycobacterium asiaticum TaxID=1790 RepID=A0A1A3NKQ7_MYCAS|nr:hypothetical protein [Mycobacterium asiaticum]OBK21930.1 hypothetical protein A5634_08795 [Mycobacterium asiaticum]